MSLKTALKLPQLVQRGERVNLAVTIKRRMLTLYLITISNLDLVDGHPIRLSRRNTDSNRVIEPTQLSGVILAARVRLAGNSSSRLI